MNKVSNLLQQILEEKNKQKDREFKVLTNEFAMRMFKAGASGDKEELKKLSEESEAKRIKDRPIYKERFVDKYGKQVFDFISSLMKEDWFLYQNEDYCTLKSWNLYDEEGDYNDDVQKIYFYRGRFVYQESWAGEYAGGRIIEDNLSQERVLEIIKEHGGG